MKVKGFPNHVVKKKVELPSCSGVTLNAANFFLPLLKKNDEAEGRSDPPNKH